MSNTVVYLQSSRRAAAAVAPVQLYLETWVDVLRTSYRAPRYDTCI